MKPLVWRAEEIAAPPFSPEARLEAAELLMRLQHGEKLSMPLSRPMPAIGPACHELRIRDRDATWRIFYAFEPDAIVLLHVARKTSRKTATKDIDLSRKRLRNYRFVRRTVDRGQGGRTFMIAKRAHRLQAAGWKVGDASEFLGLSPEETTLVKMKIALGASLKRHRVRRKLTQEALADRLGSSQSRVAKLEAGARGVTLDLLFRALLAAGATTAQIASDIRPRRGSGS